MADYDDRPISVYDNLHPATTTATIAKSTPTATSTPKAKAMRTNGARSPYDEIGFRFNGNNRLPNGLQRTQPPATTSPSPCPNPSSSQSPSPSQVQPPQSSVALYATPVKRVAPTTAATTSSPTTPTTNSSTIRTTAGAAASAQRPLSQHSQSELNEASQSIAAVKAALNDAKSKFFGLNGYAQDSPADYAHPHAHHESPTYQLIGQDAQPQRAKVQIVPPAKPQPKYQNIPENSAIFRSQQSPAAAPALPPKPVDRQKSSSPDSNRLAATPSPAASSSSPLNGRTVTDGSHDPHDQPPSMSPAPAPTPTPTPMASQKKQLPPMAAYKQLPLNDIDAPQPSQTVYMSTTVPQNIKGSKIAGRHTPTRNSLRHSRMLVVNNKNYQATQHPNPMNFRHPNLARCLLILEIMIGILLTCLAIWIFLLAPNTAIQDNPYWSGLALLLAGVIGLVLVRYQRIKRHKVRENCFLFLRADSYLLSLVAVLLCVVALICASIHFARLTADDTQCESSNILLEHGSCSCTFNAPARRNRTDADDDDAFSLPEDVPEEFNDASYSVEYRDLSCQEVRGEWTFILGASMALNSLGFVVSLVYIVLLACCRHDVNNRFYSSVHTSTF